MFQNPIEKQINNPSRSSMAVFSWALLCLSSVHCSMAVQLYSSKGLAVHGVTGGEDDPHIMRRTFRETQNLRLNHI